MNSFAIEGPLLFTPKLISDERVFFYESWKIKSFAICLGMDPDVTPLIGSGLMRVDGCGHAAAPC